MKTKVSLKLSIGLGVLDVLVYVLNVLKSVGGLKVRFLSSWLIATAIFETNGKLVQAMTQAKGKGQIKNTGLN
jgi:hypothetical protein